MDDAESSFQIVTTLETIRKTTARERYESWKQGQEKELRSEMSKRCKEVRHNLNCWLSLLPTETAAYSWIVSSARFEISSPLAVSRHIADNIQTELMQLRDAGFYVHEQAESAAPEHCGSLVIAITCPRLTEDLPHVTRGLVQPRLTGVRSIATRFFEKHDDRKFEGGGPVILSSEDAGLDRMAVTIRKLFEMGICTEVRCRMAFADVANKFKIRYSQSFVSADLHFTVVLGSNIVITGHAPDGRLSITLDVKDFIEVQT